MIQTFDRDLKIGKKYEQVVLEAIRQKYSQAFIQEGYCKEWDIYIPELSFGIEVKSDKKSMHTGNIVIEIEFNGKPSALSTTKSKYWVIYDGYNYKWFLVDDIKKCIKEIEGDKALDDFKKSIEKDANSWTSQINKFISKNLGDLGFQESVTVNQAKAWIISLVQDIYNTVFKSIVAKVSSQNIADEISKQLNDLSNLDRIGALVALIMSSIAFGFGISRDSIGMPMQSVLEQNEERSKIFHVIYAQNVIKVIQTVTWINGVDKLNSNEEIDTTYLNQLTNIHRETQGLEVSFENRSKDSDDGRWVLKYS